MAASASANAKYNGPFFQQLLNAFMSDALVGTRYYGNFIF
jgi:hypothetical protein